MTLSGKLIAGPRCRVANLLARRFGPLSGEENEMTALLHRLETRPKTPAARLVDLLEPLKDFCDAEEFARHRDEVMTALSASGFRAAREFVVRLHQDLKAEARRKQREEEESA